MTREPTDVLYKVGSKAPKGVSTFIDDIVVMEFADTLSGMPPPIAATRTTSLASGAMTLKR